MNKDMRPAAMDESVAAKARLRETEAYYLQARNVFGTDSAEAKVAWSCWHTAQRKVRVAG
jgi:hypothetical protein